LFSFAGNLDLSDKKVTKTLPPETADDPKIPGAIAAYRGTPPSPPPSPHNRDISSGLAGLALAGTPPGGSSQTRGPKSGHPPEKVWGDRGRPSGDGSIRSAMRGGKESAPAGAGGLLWKLPSRIC